MSIKKIIVSYEKLSDELQDKFQKKYKDGLNGKVERFTKPNGESLSIVPLITDDTHYMVKVNALLHAIASKHSDDDEDKDYDSDDDFASKNPSSDDEEEDDTKGGSYYMDVEN